MRLCFLGTPDAAVRPLRALVAAGHEVDLVVTRADKRRGRGSALVPSPVKAAAVELGLPVTSDVDAVLGRGLDLGVVVAFGRIIKPHVLAEVAMVNLHFSLLPRWRGAAPVERAVLAGDAETGVCVMAVAEGLDEGGVFALERTRIDPEETVSELRDRLVELGTDLLIGTLAGGLGPPAPQQGSVSYAAKITPAELRLDWTEPASTCHARVRLGRAWTEHRGGRLLVTRATTAEVFSGSFAGRPTRSEAAPPVQSSTWPETAGGAAGAPGQVDAELGVACGDGRRLLLVEVQPAGKGPMPARAWANGARPVGDRLG